VTQSLSLNNKTSELLQVGAALEEVYRGESQADKAGGGGLEADPAPVRMESRPHARSGETSDLRSGSACKQPTYLPR
jgi:hypothetical protein